MPHLVYAIPCLQVIHDSATNLMNYLNCIEQLSVPHLPFEFGELTVGTNWVREQADDRLHVRLRVVSPSGDTVAEKATDPKAFDTFERFRFNLRLPVFEVREEGDYLIQVETEANATWTTRASLPVRVSVVSPNEAEGAA